MAADYGPHVLARGTQVKKFKILGVLGRGGFGITYRARHISSTQEFALKELFIAEIGVRDSTGKIVPSTPDSAPIWEWARERFAQEAEMLARFQHPSIVRVHELFSTNGTVYFTMDLLSGGSLEQWLQRHGAIRDQRTLWALIEPLLSGLELIHEASVFHRDIKPENILFSGDGTPVLVDFGAARTATAQTATVTTIVTPGYAPIEQYGSRSRVGPWTDIYALAGVMYRAISGERPVAAPDRSDSDGFSVRGVSAGGNFDRGFLQAIDVALNYRLDSRPRDIATWRGMLMGQLVAPASPEASGATSRSIRWAMVLAAWLILGVLYFWGVLPGWIAVALGVFAFTLLGETKKKAIQPGRVSLDQATRPDPPQAPSERVPSTRSSSIWSLVIVKSSETGWQEQDLLIDEDLVAATHGQIILGRRKELAHLQVNNTSVSKQHATLFVEGEAIVIQDRGSSNGTRVNGRLLAGHERAELREGDLIEMGDVVMELRRES